MAVYLAGNGGPRKLWGGRDADGHRTWYAIFRVMCGLGDGPANALQCPGLPVEGTQWIIRDDIDVYAWCRTENTVTPVGEWPVGRGWCFAYDVQYTFSTRPPTRDRGGRNQPEGSRPRKEDPLQEFDRVSGGFVKTTEESAYDRFGVPHFTTSFEPIRGAQVEFDKSRMQVRVEQNVPDLQLSLLAELVDTVNDEPLWGLPARCWKLSVPNWERKYHGSGIQYYTRSLEFESNVFTDPLTGEIRSGFDREVYDEGSKCLNGRWNSTTGVWELVNIAGEAPDPGNPSHYKRYQDRDGNVARCFFDNTYSGKPLEEKMAGKIIDVTAAAPIQVTSEDHGLANGDTVVIRNFGGVGADAVNGIAWTVGGVAADSFTLLGSNAVVTAQVTPATVWLKLNNSVNKIRIEKYESGNFLLLGIPTEF